MAKATKQPLTDAELKAPITKANFYRRAEHFIRTTFPGAPLPTISPGSQEWDEWREYFERHLGWVPVAMRKIIDRAPDAPLVMTVPTQFPQQFDMTFRADPQWKPPPIVQISPRSLHERLEELHRRYGPQWGIKDMGALRRRPQQPWQSPSDDELRARYAPRQAAE